MVCGHVLWVAREKVRLVVGVLLSLVLVEVIDAGGVLSMDD